MKTLQIAIPDQLAAQLGAMVTAGRYENETEIVRLALNAWLQESQLNSGSVQASHTMNRPHIEKANGAPESELGHRLRAIRQRIVTSGDHLLLDWDGVAQEVADRRGER